MLIGGRDVDTGVYEYLPYAHKLVTDFSTTRKIVKKLKAGDPVDNADEYVYSRYCVNSETTNQEAIEAAFKAFLQYRKFPLTLRRNIFLTMYELLLENKEKLIDLFMAEGHPRRLAEWEFEGMELGGRPELINYYYKQLRRTVGRHDGEALYLARKPDGVVCVNAPGNAPASNSYLAAYALLAGNALIIKPPFRNPVSTIYLWKEVVEKALRRYSVPPGTLNIVVGKHQKILSEWLASAQVSDVLHFGDSEKGIEIAARVFEAGKKPILELSGNDIFILWKDGDLAKAADSLLDAFLGSSQICMVPKIAVIHADVYDRFMKIFLERASWVKPEPFDSPDAILSPVLKIPDFFNFLTDAVDKGASILCGGKRVNAKNEEDVSGIFIQPTVLQVDSIEAALRMKCISEEIFFPLVPCIKAEGADDKTIFSDIISFVNKHNYGLRASLWTSSSRYIRKFAKELDNSGTLRINLRHVGFSYYLSTHGGTRKSGGPFGEMNYVWQKTSHLQGIAISNKHLSL